MMLSRPMRTREFKGPTPGSVAIRARMPNSRPPDHHILEQRKKDENIREQEREEKRMKLFNLKNDWVQATDKKIEINVVKKKVEGLMQAQRFAVEDRRDRLRELLRTEEELYIAEMEASEETTLERQAKMRERAKFLKDKREQERLQFVQEKLDQQFRNQCEELRSTLTKRGQDQVCAERLEQLRLKEEVAAERQAEEAMYARLWEQDMLDKAAREEREAQEQRRRNLDTVDVLRQQMAALDAQKEEAKKLKEEEAQLLKEQGALRKMEEEKAQEEKIRRQKETRDMLDLSMKMKMKKKAKDEQEQLAFDLKMLEQLLEESRNEAREQEQRKRELREEDRRYREYLRRLYEEEKEEEEKLQGLIQEEVEKNWQKRLDQWRNERLARKKLLEDVMAGRAVQIQRRLLDNESQQIVAQKEKEELLQQMEEYRREEAVRGAKEQAKSMQYQRDLEGQMDYNARLRDQLRSEEQAEVSACHQAELEYEGKLKFALDHPYVGRMHPMRRQLMKQQQQPQ